MAEVGSMDTVMILKRFMHAERAGLWEEHLAVVEKMLRYSPPSSSLPLQIYAVPSTLFTSNVKPLHGGSKHSSGI